MNYLGMYFLRPIEAHLGAATVSDPSLKWPAPTAWVPAALYIILKFFCCWSKLFALYHPDYTVPLLLMSEALNYLVQIPWSEVSLAIEAITFEKARSTLQALNCSDVEEEEVLKANRKSTSLPDVCKVLLEICWDQFTASFVIFAKVGCGPLLACGAAFTILLVPLILQLLPKSSRRIR